MSHALIALPPVCLLRSLRQGIPNRLRGQIPDLKSSCLHRAISFKGFVPIRANRAQAPPGSSNDTDPPRGRAQKDWKKSWLTWSAGKLVHLDEQENYNLHERIAALRMKSHIQFITSPTLDTQGTALLLHFDDHRYIFGRFHEGLQRSGLEFGTRFLKVRDFFLTGKTEWMGTGGLMGMILTLADGANSAAAAKADAVQQKAAKAKEQAEELEKKGDRGGGDQSAKQELALKDPTLRIHGGPNLAHTLATARRFIFRQGMPIDVCEFGEKDASREHWQPDFEDERVKIWALPLKPIQDSQDGQSKSPRKRSLGDYMEGQRHVRDEQLKDGNPLGEDSDNWQRDQQTRHDVVREMFQSKWRFDRLIETPLEEVKMPAVLYLRDPTTKLLSKYRGPYPGEASYIPGTTVLVKAAWPGALIDTLPPTKPSPVAASYIVRNQRQRGKFRPDEARRLGVEPGPLFAKLSKGDSVTSKDGKTITPEMVLEPAKEGSGVMIIDLPEKGYISAFLSRAELQTEEIMSGVGACIWLLGTGMSQDQRLLNFMQARNAMKHIVSSTDVCADEFLMQSAAAGAIKHHQIDPDHFPLLNSSSKGVHQVKDDEAKVGHTLFIPAKQGLKLQLEPSMEIDDTAIKTFLNEARVREEMPKEVRAHSDEGRTSVKSARATTLLASQDLPSPDAEIISLGTGSSVPSKHRNVSGTLLRVPGCGSYLLDCGENTLGQLRRMFSPAELDEIFDDLKLIWISHLHADHHLGTASIIKAWYDKVHKAPSQDGKLDDKQETDLAKRLGQKKLFIVSNPEMASWLHEYSGVEDIGYEHIVPLKTTYEQYNPYKSPLFWNETNLGFHTAESNELKLAMREATSLSNLNYCNVAHCHGAYAVSLNFPTGFKFSYSGDCRPSEMFTRIGLGSTVLVHEATFDDDMKADAKAKKHSTMSEAIAVGVAMQARRVILTHFSQRYSKLPNMDDLDRTALKLEDTEDASDEEPLGGEPSVDVPRESVADGEKLAANDPAIEEAKAALIKAPPNKDIKVAIAFDYMRVKVKDIMLLEKFNPAMRELYKEREEDKEKERPESALSVRSTEKAAKSARQDRKQQRKQEQKTLQKEEKERKEQKAGKEGQKGKQRSGFAASARSAKDTLKVENGERVEDHREKQRKALAE